MENKKISSRIRRKKGIRKKISGNSSKPRVTVFRSLKHIYAQVIDDETGNTMLSLSTLKSDIKKDLSNCGNKKAAEYLGKLLNEKIKEKGIKEIVFDRNGYLFHGRIKALADQIVLREKRK